ncbi:uncharacterized protein LOC116304756 [Actinia tenebrosa]|uniref:Uncharacterized protein LOC116304756 n=1 Tax=Actinia tenebrosa TaxID=6105 RepID=A0A6P8IWG5_ACTTE|nr:uncharacterized protein LOC116304756 [Actinia tenebrosa]
MDNAHIVRCIFIVLAALAYATNLFISQMSDPKRRPPSLQFIYGTSNKTGGGISRMYPTDVKPASWAFSIWPVIYTWQCLWILYSLTFIVRKSLPPVQNWLFFVLFTLSSVSVTSSVLLRHRFLIEAQVVTNCLLYIFLCATLGTSFYRFDRIVNKHFPKFDFWAIQVLIHNGLGLYCSWVAVASLLGINKALIYVHGFAKPTAGSIILGILAVELIVWFIVENTVFERVARYTVTIYPACIVALSGLVAKNRSSKQNYVFAIVLLCLVVVMFIARLVLVARRIFLIHRTSRSDDMEFIAVACEGAQNYEM